MTWSLSDGRFRLRRPSSFAHVRVVAVDGNGDGCLRVWSGRPGSVPCSWTSALGQPSSGCGAPDCVALVTCGLPDPYRDRLRERSSQTALRCAWTVHPRRS